MIGELPPFLIFLVGAVLVALAPRNMRSAVAVAVPVFGLANILMMDKGVYWVTTFFGQELTFGRVDQLGWLFCLLFHIASLIGQIFAFHVKDAKQHVSSILYAGGAIGVALAGDLLTLIIFWEVVGIAPVLLIWARGTERAYGAGMRYLLVQLASGTLLLMGIVARYQATGSLDFNFIGLEGLSGWLIFLAFGIKCAWPFLHTWAVDAYPEATPTGTIFLSAFTTKVAVYALCRGYPGTDLLIYIGTAMAMFPIFYAVIENDLRKVLAYSLINQIGFMVVGIGIGTELALNGAVAHAFNDVVFKGLLFMSMGAVLHLTGRMNGSDLGGLYKSMPLTTIFCIVGAASISAFPLFSGFVSKALVVSAAAKEGHTMVFLALLFASAGVFHHAGIKIPYFAFFAHDSGIRTKEAPWNMLLAMGIAAAICIFNGSYPHLLYSMMPWEVDYEPYTLDHIITQLQLLAFSALAFALLMVYGIYPPELRLVNLDSDWLFFRKGGPLAAAFAWFTRRCGEIRDDAVGDLVRGTKNGINYLYAHHGPEGLMARTWPTGRVVFWAIVILGAYLLVDYAFMG